MRRLFQKPINPYYILAFLLPAAIVLMAYFCFLIEPFGDNSVLALDLNGQYVYYFENLRDAFWGNGSFINSWSRNLSGEFVGIFAYYLASPFTIIVMLFPRAYMTEALLVMQLLKVGCAGLTFCFFLCRCRKVKPSVGLIFSICYACMAYMIVQLMNPMWIDGLIYLPLICFAIEMVIDKGRFAFFAIVLALMFMANFYIGWMVAIFCCLYFITYYFFLSDKTPDRKFTYFIKSGIKFAAGGLLAAACAAWLLLPLYSSLSLGKFDFTTPKYEPKTYFDILLFFKNMLPNVYDTCRPEGSPVVYCGVFVLILIPLFFMNSQIRMRKKIGIGALTAVILLSMYVSTVDLVWHGFQLPNWLPYRYSFIFSFLCLIMAAEAVSHIKGITPKNVGAVFFGVIIYTLWIDMQEIPDVTEIAVVWCTIVFAGIYALLLYYIIKGINKGKNIKNIMVTLLCFTIVEFGISTTSNIYQINGDIAYSRRSSYNRFITLGRNTVEKIYAMDTEPVYRIEKNFKRTVNDAMAFGSFGISHSSSTLNAGPIEFLRKLGFGYGGHYIEYNGETYVSDAILGIKYVIERGTKGSLIKDDFGMVTDRKPDTLGISKHYDDLVLVNGDDTDIFCVYENPYALPVAFMANNAIADVNLPENNPFEAQNQLLSKLTGDSTRFFFRRIKIDEIIPENVTEGNYGAHDKWTSTVPGQNAQVEFKFTAPTDDMVYAFFPAVYERQVNMWLDGQFVNYYFEGGKMSVQTLGRLEPDSEHSLILTIGNEKEEMLYTDEEIYYLDTEMFTDAVDTLREGGLNVTSFTESHIEGNVTAKEDGILFTTISYEPGWTVYVDGEKAETVPLCDNALIGIPLTAGYHDIEMRFFPQYMKYGIIISIAALAIIILIAVIESRKATKEAADRVFKLRQLDIFDLLEHLETNTETVSDVPEDKPITNTETVSDVPDNELIPNTEIEYDGAETDKLD